MAKRQSRPPSQSNSGIDSAEFSKLLSLQEETLSTQKTIKELLASGSMSSSSVGEDVKALTTLTTNMGETLQNQIKVMKIEREIADLQKEQTDLAKEELKAIKESAKARKEESEAVAKIADGMKTFNSLGDKMGDLRKGFSDKFGSGNKLKTTMSALNVGGVFNKAIAKQDFIKQQKALGSTKTNKELAEDFAGAQKSAKAVQSNNKDIAAFEKRSGLSGADIGKTKEGAALLAKRSAAASEYAKFDMKPGILSSKGSASSPIVATSVGESQEAGMENAKMVEEQTTLLRIIAEKVGGNPAAASTASAPTKAGGGLLDGITGLLGNGLMNTFKTLFSPKNLLKSLGKVFAIGAIIGALWEGITDGFDEYMKSGSIGKALIAGLAGIVDFLTFGLFDKDKIKEVIGDFASWTDEHMIQPFVKFITGIKDSFMSLIENIGIPEIKFTIPVINKDVAIGPFYPFKADGKPAAAAAAPTSAEKVSGASKENADEAAAASKPSSNTSVVNAPTTNVTKQTQIIKAPIRNQESSQSRYGALRYV